jgi:hypothetical protein
MARNYIKYLGYANKAFDLESLLYEYGSIELEESLNFYLLNNGIIKVTKSEYNTAEGEIFLGEAFDTDDLREILNSDAVSGKEELEQTLEVVVHFENYEPISVEII